MRVTVIKSRDAGWLVVPRRWLEDNGPYYRVRFVVFERIIYKSSIDREYNLHGLVALLLLPLWMLSFVVIQSARAVWSFTMALLRW